MWGEVAAPLHFVIVDLRAEKDTVVILRDLQSAFPFAKVANSNSNSNPEPPPRTLAFPLWEGRERNP
jgi:hypothetical protein